MKEKTINLYGIRKQVILCRTNDNNKQYVLMQALTKSEEQAIDTYNEYPDLYNKDFPFKPNNNNLIKGDNIYFYGEIDFKNKDDVDVINKLNLVDSVNGGWMYSDFDFHTSKVIISNGIKMAPTWDAVKWFKYNYVLLGKPKRVIVYKISHLNGKHK